MDSIEQASSRDLRDVVQTSSKTVPLIETAKQIALEPVVSAMPEQLDLFVSHTESEIVKTLENLDIMDITPLQAMQILYDLKKKIKA